MSDPNAGSSYRSGSLLPLSTPRAIATPNRRALSGEPTSGRPSARRNNVATPHARAAIRAMDQRRAALFTPGRARRRSLREQRETPRDVLRNLSRVLAPTSKVVSSSSSPDSTVQGADSTLPPFPEDDEFDDDDDDFPIERPRFSLPLGPDDDDDDDDLKPPQLSGLEEDNYTMQSIELPRRAITDPTIRSSLGSMRYSDYMGPDIRSDDDGIDSGFFPPPALDDSAEVVMDEPVVIERCVVLFHFFKNNQAFVIRVALITYAVSMPMTRDGRLSAATACLGPLRSLTLETKAPSSWRPSSRLCETRQ